MRVLVACEESQTVCKAFRERGHEAYSCDFQASSGGHPEWHIRKNCTHVIAPNKFGLIKFSTEDNFFNVRQIYGWDLIILHPPCTKVSVSGNGTYAGTTDRIAAANWNADLFFLAAKVCTRVAMEQPVTVLPTIRPDLPKPYYVDLWWFGTRECKKTAWYTYGLPKLKMTNNVGPPPKGQDRRHWMKTWMMTPSDDRGKLRSKLDPNMAKAMAEQWG